MRRFANPYALFQVDLEDKEFVNLESEAEAGDALACYKYGRLLYCLRYESDYVDLAIDYLTKAQEGGIIDADVALALAWRRGEMGQMNPYKASQLIMGALQKGSEFAAQVVVSDLIFGGWGCDKNPQHAVKMLEDIIAQCDNPVFLMLMGHAMAATEGLSASREWYQKAVDAGYVDAYPFYAEAMSHNDRGECVDGEKYDQLLNEGYAAHSIYAQYKLVKYYLETITPNISDEDERQEVVDGLIEALESVAESGVGDAAELLGDTYYRGLFGVEINYEKAFSAYSRGAIYNSGACYEMMHEMISEGVAEGYNQNFADMCAVRGARFGSANMVAATVAAYKSGRLTDFAAEIEQYYMPVCEAAPMVDDEDVDDDDLPDDDGRYDAYV